MNLKLFKNIKLKLSLLLFIGIFYGNNICQKATNMPVSSVEESLKIIEENKKKLTLADVPQFKAFTQYMPKAVLDAFSKLHLKNVSIGYNSRTQTGVVSAETEINGTKAVIRLLIGAGVISKDNASGSVKDLAQRFQQNILVGNKVSKNPPKWNAAGLTYYSDKLKSAKNAAQKVKQKILDWVKKDKKKEEEQTKKSLSEKVKGYASGALAKLADLQLGIVIVLPSGFSFGSISSDLKFLDAIDFEEAAFCLGTGFYDPLLGAVPPGLSIITKIGLHGPFETLNKVITNLTHNKVNLKDTPLELRGNLTRSIGGSSFGLALPGQISLDLNHKKFIETDKFSLNVVLLPAIEGSTGVSGISFGLSGGFKLYLNNINDKLEPLDFKAFIAVDTSANATITGMMNGMLNLAAIGLPIKFGNLVVTIGVNPENVETIGLSEVGFAGDVNVGNLLLKSAIDVKLSGQNTNIMVYGNLQPKDKNRDALSLADILSIATDLFHIDNTKFKDSIPDLGIKHAKLYFSPANVFFANKTWPAGLSVDIGLDIFGVTADVEVNINNKGFDASGYLSPVNLGPLKITGEGKSLACTKTDACLARCGQIKSETKALIKPGEIRDKSLPSFKLEDKDIPNALKSKTDFSSQKGAIINLHYYPPTNLGLFISAQISVELGPLGTISTESCISLSPSGVYASFTDKAFGIMEANFTLNAKDFKKPTDWYVCAKFQQSALDLLYKKVHEFTLKAKQDVDNGIKNAQKKVDDAEKTYNNALRNAQKRLDDTKREWNAKIADAQQRVNGAKEKYDKALKAAQDRVEAAKRDYTNKINDAQKKVRDAMRKANELRNNLEKAKRECGS